MSSFSARLQKFQSDLWGYHVEVPNEIAEKFIEGTNRRVICYWGAAQIKAHAALMPSGEVGTGWFLLINNELRKKLYLELGDKIGVKLEKDGSEYGRPMPEEMDVVFAQDEVAFKYFGSLTPGKQRSLMYIVDKVKNPDSRIRKALAIAQHLREVEGQLDFKALNENIKFFNNKDKLF